MRWGSIILVDLDPVRGSEANKTRPALVVCNNRAIEAATLNGRGVITVLPITSNVASVYPFQVYLDLDAADICGLRTASKIQAEQIRSVDVRRVIRELGVLPQRLHQRVRDAVTLHLG